MSGGGLLEAQQSNTLYLMHAVPQSNLLNPAVQIQCRYYVGIPLLTSLYANYSNTAFTYNQLASTDTWNFEGVTSQMHRKDLYSVETGVQILSLGYRRKSLYVTFNIAEKIQAFQTIPGALAEMAVYGNGPFAGKNTRFDGFRPGAYHIREYALGISKVLGPYLTAGVRAKLLFGKANLSSGPSTLRATTRGSNFGIGLEGNYLLNSSFPITITSDTDGIPEAIELNDTDPLEYMMNRGNVGFGLDLGLIYRYSDEITLSASLLDLSFIRWKSDLNNVQGEGVFTYEGADLTLEFANRAFLTELADSIINSFDISTSLNPYTAMLPTQIFLAASYRYNEKISFGLTNRNVIYRSKLHSSITLSGKAMLAERFSGTMSWSYLNNSLLNMGIGIAWHGKGIHFHAVTDNVLGFFFPFDTRTINLRAGFNLMLGCPRNKKERLKEESYGFLPKGGYCPFPDKPEKTKKKRKKAVYRINRN